MIPNLWKLLLYVCFKHYFPLLIFELIFLVNNMYIFIDLFIEIHCLLSSHDVNQVRKNKNICGKWQVEVFTRYRCQWASILSNHPFQLFFLNSSSHNSCINLKLMDSLFQLPHKKGWAQIKTACCNKHEMHSWHFLKTQ